jgi:hypothetical protein
MNSSKQTRHLTLLHSNTLLPGWFRFYTGPKYITIVGSHFEILVERNFYNSDFEDLPPIPDEALLTETGKLVAPWDILMDFDNDGKITNADYKVAQTRSWEFKSYQLEKPARLDEKIPMDVTFQKWLTLYKQWIEQVPDYKKVTPANYQTPTASSNGIITSSPVVNLPQSTFNCSSFTTFKDRTYFYDTIVPTNISLHSTLCGSDSDDDFFVSYANNLLNHKRYLQSDPRMSEIVVWFKDSDGNILEPEDINMKFRIEVILETN